MKTTEKKLQELKDIAESVERTQHKYKYLHECFIKDIQPELDEATKGMNEFDEIHCGTFVIVALNAHENYVSGKDQEFNTDEAMYRCIRLVNINTLC